MLRSLDRPTTPMEEKQLVIKVSYGETLRRFSVSFNGTGSLELDMLGLRTKIFNLFIFEPYVDLTLTYVDEDGDRVTLVDDADLHDAIKQHLNPLRILISSNSDRAKNFKMSGGFTALRSFSNNSLGCIPLARPTCPPLPQLPSFPIGVRPSNPSMPFISRDLASSTPSSSRADTLPPPTFLPFLRPPSAPKGVRPFNPSMPPIPRDLVSSTPSSTKDEILAKQRIFSLPSISTGTAPESYHDYTRKLTGSVSMVPPPPPPKFCQFTPSRSQVSCDLVSNPSSSIKNADALGLENPIEMASKKVYNDSEKSEDSKTTDRLKTLKNTLSASELLLKGDDMNLEVNSAPSSSSIVNISNPQNAAKVDVPQDAAKVDISFPHMFCFNSGKIPQKDHKDYPSGNCVSICGSPSLSTALRGKDLPENLVAHQLNDSVTGQMGPSASNTGTPSTALRGKDLPENLVAHQLNDSVTGQIAQSASNTDPACSMHPQRVNGVWISLPGLNLVKPADGSQNIQSMSEMGRSVTRPPKRINNKEMGEILHLGIRCDGCGVYPIAGPRFKSKVEVDYDLCSICFAALGNEEDYTRLVFPISYKSRLPKFPSSQVTRPLLLSNNRWKCRPKLDSRFVKDVNIFDGTIMPPSTSFTKIWRMQNNGADSWPRGTQLICMGEDWLTNLASFELELPDEGCPVGMHYNVAVDLTAPEQPGYYGSYWRMASPSGDKFGQCIWVIIEVDASLGDTECGIQNLNLNLPPDSVDVKNEIIDLKDELVNASTQRFYPYKLDAELMKPGVNENQSKEVQAMHDDLWNHPAVLAVKPLRNLDTSESARGAAAQTLLGEVSDEINLEQSLLMDLEDMGFKEIGLNREILRANNYDLARSLDDLCSVPNWEFLLEELQQMGFPDKETNRRLLVKNGGSIKQVVKELLAAEKD